MKKRILSVFLVGVMLMFSACGNTETNEVGKADSNIETEAAVPEAAEDETISETEEIGYTETEVMGDTLVIPMEAKTMYSTTQANVRKGPGTVHEAVGTLAYGEGVTVDGYTEDGWYRISYNGQSAYVSSKLLQDKQPASAATTTTANTGYTNEYCVGLAKEIFDATNAERAKAGLPALIWDDRLAAPAGVRAQEIITVFSHVRADGTKCYVLSPLIYGENIARGPHATGAEFLEHWMASEGHKANILEPKYKTMGVGFTCTDQGDTAVQLFGVE